MHKKKSRKPKRNAGHAKRIVEFTLSILSGIISSLIASAILNWLSK